MSARDLILNEFTLYYRGDEVDVEQLEDLRDRAESSALRLASEAGVQGAPQVVSLLRELRDNRAHPFHESIGISSELWWAQDDELFLVFQQVVDWMLARLALITSSGPP
ncbi:MAG: hypothetical protein K8W52_24515 [Deltaproteobacteria bacterium]|nr:hypothetical protein [Deltaproteobacteria bacterium]